MIPRHRPFACCLILSLLIVGCVSDREYRKPPLASAPGSGKSESNVTLLKGTGYASLEKYSTAVPANDPIRTPFTHTTAYIEFDEQGDFMDRRQLLAALADQPIYHDPKRLLIFYAHGWQNNTRSRDVALFNQFIAHLNRALGQVDDGSGQKRWTVYGVYLAWRGTTLEPVNYVEPHNDDAIEGIDSVPVKTNGPLWVPVTLVKYFTFWSRKAAASRFAGAPLLETIYSISNKVRGSHNDGHVLSKTVLMGHSFGAYIIEKTLLQSIASEEEAGQSGGGQASITPPADLVVLLNSAAPAIYAKEFIDFLKWHKVGRADQPFVVSITSEADDATKLAFPAGTIPEAAFDVGSYQGSDSPSYKGVNQKVFFTHTPGHCAYLVSHDVVPDRQPTGDFFTGDKDDWLLHENLFAGSPLEEKVFRNMHVDPRNQIVLWGDNGYEKTTANSDPQVWSINPSTPAGYNDTAYWILRVPKQIISGHGDVWNPNTASLIAGLVRIAGLVPDSLHPDTKLRSLSINEFAEPANETFTPCSPYPENAGLLH